MHARRICTIGRTVLAGLVLAGLGVTGALAGPGASGHAHGAAGHDMSFGQPGDPGEVDRTIRITAHEMDYSVRELEVKAGETIRFVITNQSQLMHDFTLGDAETQAAHRREMMAMMENGSMMGNGHMQHDDPNAVLLEPGETKELVWHFDEAGELEFACNVPGHYEAGMKGHLSVTSGDGQ